MKPQKPLQLKPTGATTDADPDPHNLASEGVQGPGQRLPHLAAIQRSFGSYDVTNVQAHVGGAAAQSCDGLGALAYATGERIGFRDAPSLHTAAHEAAHVVQQRSNPSLPGGVGAPGDGYEQNADAVADRVVQGRSAEDLLAAGSRDRSGTPAVQMVPGDVDISGALAALREFDQAEWNLIEGTQVWLIANWLDYIADTCSEPSLSSAAQLGIEGVTNLVGEGVQLAARHGSKALIRAVCTGVGAAAGGIGAVIGYIVGTLIEFALEVLADALWADTTYADAADDVRDQLGPQLLAIHNESQAAMERHVEVRGIFDEELNALTSQAEVDAFAERVRALRADIPDPPPITDRTLYDDMLSVWVLEHAGDEEDANEDTDEAQWEAAAGSDGLEGRTDIFAYQTRLLMRRLGIESHIQEFTSAANRAADMSVDEVLSHWDDFEYRITRTQRPLALASFLNDELDFESNLVYHLRSYSTPQYTGNREEIIDAWIVDGHFFLKLFLDLTDADGAVFVDYWDFELKGPENVTIAEGSVNPEG